MTYKHILYIIVFLYHSISQAQHVHTSTCGVTIQDQILNEILHPNDFRGNQNRNTTVYVPVKFHAAAKSDGTGRIEVSHIIEQLCILNRDYASSGMVFYIYDGIRFINNSSVYLSPGTNGNTLQTQKSSKAINVFITENADPQGDQIGTVLGYYSPQGDYVVVRKKELVDRSNTLSHEIGHFFNLRHTFYGWENAPYDRTKHGEQVTFTSVPGGISGVAVELMNKSNCTNAADMICDTPPDYNFGFGATTCTFSKTVLDRNGDKVIPMTNNQMSYFLTCDTFRFTEGQDSRMMNNFLSSTRSYLSSSYIPNTTDLTDVPVMNSPSAGEKINTWNDVKLDWNDVPGASQYLIEIKGQSQYFYAITSASEYNALQLKKNNIYFWTVKPFNEGYGCSPSKTANFRTGDGTATNTNENTEALPGVTVSPNPIQEKVLRFEVHMPMDADCMIDLTDMTGKKFMQTSSNLHMGTNQVLLDVPSAASGMYILRLQTIRGSVFSKIIIP